MFRKEGGDFGVMNEYRCAKCGESWFSAKGPAEIYCPDKCLICGGDLLYAGPAGAKSDNKVQEVEMVEELAAYAAEPEISGGGKDDKMIPLCPLSLEKCKEEKCAWWHETEIVCAVKLIAIRLRK